MENNKVLEYVIYIIIFAILVLALYCIYDEYKDVNNKTTVILNNEQQELSKLEILSLIEKNEGDMYFVNNQDNDIESVPQYINSLSNQVKLQYVYRYSESLDTFIYGNNFSANDFDVIADNLFGYHNSIKHEDINCFCDNIVYYYDESTGMYIFNKEHVEHGYGPETIIYNYLDKFSYDDGLYILNVKKVYALYDGNFLGGYSSYEIDQGNIIIGENDKCLNITVTGEKLYNEKCYEEYKNSFKTYQYVFAKNNGKYSLQSYKLIKE